MPCLALVARGPRGTDLHCFRSLSPSARDVIVPRVCGTPFSKTVSKNTTPRRYSTKKKRFYSHLIWEIIYSSRYSNIQQYFKDIDSMAKEQFSKYLTSKSFDQGTVSFCSLPLPTPWNILRETSQCVCMQGEGNILMFVNDYQTQANTLIVSISSLS